MIRFPERFHASDTPGANYFGVEPNYQEARRQPPNPCPARGEPPHPRFDFAALREALER